AATTTRVDNTDVSDGGFNEIDAQAGFKKAATPSYAVDAIARAVHDPNMRAYLGHLVSREAPGGARSVSPT
ncbi:hypothetical protein, partial [Bacillus subtilis]|uniref:hypothetical protein n=1 Tax=Bacillus subtilis TaxID=1423 RepID=UPI003C25524C